ncbi:hypothetical protein DB347_09285 [Opitutaceae bacterium EW11]|nr:hypothetical protein DB347_09285 [Opitutaceae bacterium EW11]
MPLSARFGLVLASLVCTAVAPAASPEISYTGNDTVSSRADGGLPPVVGVQNIQVYRANRTHSEHAERLPDTYAHAPMLAWWHGRFYLDFLTAPVNEHDAPTATSYTTSEDGVHWAPARILFPAMPIPGGGLSVMHQRMSFYVSPDDRLLATGFHGKTPSPNDGSGFGRVVREIRRDGTLGPIYFLRFNRNSRFTETSAPYPFYTTSPDPGLVKACEALLANKLVTAQWWEEDRAEDGFYRLQGKAISIFHRADGKAVGVAKDAQHSVSGDEGQSWTRLGFMENIPVNSSKYWGQRTSDGRFVLVYNPTNRLRHPLALITGDDGKRFDRLLTVHAELPVQRFPGKFKNLGPQYVRGISEGNGTPPDGALWLTYSVNKEDIWVSRVPVPIVGAVGDSVNTDFSTTPLGAMPTGWNVYRPLWAPVQVVEAGDGHGHALELRDEDPYDYAQASRVFPSTLDGVIRFAVLPRQESGRLEIDLASARGERPVQIALTESGLVEARHEGIWMPAGSYRTGQWLAFEIELRHPDRFVLRIDGKEALARTAYFTDLVPSIDRLVFRTGAYRERGDGGHELSGADVRTPACAFLIDDVSITSKP